MVKDLITNTIRNIKKNKIKNINDVYNSKEPIVSFSSKIQKVDREIKNFLRKIMYNNKNVLKKNNKGKIIINKLFQYISKNLINLLITIYLNMINIVLLLILFQE